MKRILLLFFIIFSFKCYAVPYHGDIYTFKQPDGTVVKVKLYGDEYYIRAESMNGYTVVRDEKTNWICYAYLSNDKSTFVSSGIKYTESQDDMNLLNKRNDIEPHLTISQKALLEARRKQTEILDGKSSPVTDKKTRGTPIVPVSGHIKGLCIIVDFPDEPGTVPIGDFEDFCNDMNYTGYGNKGSLRTYFSDISGGIVDYENVVYGYYHAPKNFTYYDSLPYATGARMILDSALHWIQAQGFDFSTLSLNNDNTIRAINLMYTGVPPVWAKGMWHHKGSYKGFTANGVTSKDYNCSPANAPLTISVVAHENGHMIGKWPDTYKYTNTNGVDGIGTFDLMCWPGNDGTNPVPPNPLFTSNAGWKTVIDLTNYNGLIYDTANTFVCYKYVNMNDTNEFFIFENRRKNGRSQQIEDQGLTVWHIDRNGNNQTTHHEVFLEHASNNNNAHNKACFRNGFKNEFGSKSIPNTNFYNGDPSGLRIWEISDSAYIMNYKIGKGVPSSMPRILYTGITEDKNGNNNIEPGENFKFNLKALNVGQMNTAPAFVRCQTLYDTLGYVSIEAPLWDVGVIPSSGSIPVWYKIKIKPETPIGTELTFRYTISDGQDSIYVTKKFIVGYIMNMNNQNSNSCAVVFYDDAGVADYANNKNYTKTFFPKIIESPFKSLLNRLKPKAAMNVNMTI